MNVRVDQAAPTMSSITGNGSGFYPYPDTYRDTFSPAFTLNEAATVTLTVRTGSGAVVRTVTGSRAAVRTTITWNGRNTAGALVGAGTYYWTVTAQDPAGNRRTSAQYSVAVSGKRLVTKAATLTKNGSQFTAAGGSDSYCSGASTEPVRLRSVRRVAAEHLRLRLRWPSARGGVLPLHPPGAPSTTAR